MERRPHIDAAGAAALIGLSLLLAFNQVVVKVVNDGFQPVYVAGLRSVGAVLCVWLWIRLRGRSLDLRRDCLLPGLLIGALFAAEFVCLFVALDLTTVARTSIIFYSMPVWLALGAHVLIPGDRITPRKAAGLAIAFLGVAWAIGNRDGAGQEASLPGDLLALAGALAWAGVVLTARTTKLRHLHPEMQQIWQLLVSAPILLVLAPALIPLLGPLSRDPQALHWAGLGFQIVVVAAAGYLFWFWLLSVYPASGVASFSFLTPLCGVGLGAWLLGEQLGPGTLVAGLLVALGLMLINWPSRRQVVVPPPG